MKIKIEKNRESWLILDNVSFAFFLFGVPNLLILFNPLLTVFAAIAMRIVRQITDEIIVNFLWSFFIGVLLIKPNIFSSLVDLNGTFPFLFSHFRTGFIGSILHEAPTKTNDKEV